MEYKVDDRELHADTFLPFVDKIWPGNYDTEKTEAALTKTINITAYDGQTLVGCLRILSDGYFSELLQNCWCFPNIRSRVSAADF